MTVPDIETVRFPDARSNASAPLSIYTPPLSIVTEDEPFKVTTGGIVSGFLSSVNSEIAFRPNKKTNTLDILSSSAYILLSLSVISFNLDGFCVAAFSSSSSAASISS